MLGWRSDVSVRLNGYESSGVDMFTPFADVFFYIATASLLSTQRDGPLWGCGSLDLSRARNLSILLKCTQSHWLPVKAFTAFCNVLFHEENQSHCLCMISQVIKLPL